MYLNKWAIHRYNHCSILCRFPQSFDDDRRWERFNSCVVSSIVEESPGTKTKDKRLCSLIGKFVAHTLLTHYLDISTYNRLYLWNVNMYLFTLCIFCLHGKTTTFQYIGNDCQRIRI